ncbi:MAG TPA: hypothetical protein PLH04_08630 [Pseudomonadales bacterium]|nr:hypothetical protein [Pseudomonadales bacterium]
MAERGRQCQFGDGEQVAELAQAVGHLTFALRIGGCLIEQHLDRMEFDLNLWQQPARRHETGGDAGL